MFMLLSTRNPIYIPIIFATIFLLGAKISKIKHHSGWVLQNIRFITITVLLSTLINTLFAHSGQTILLKTPVNWILIGGNITLESLVYGAVNGLVIGSLYLVFNIFNLVLTTSQITKMIPKAFRPISIMITISLTFFPSIQKRIEEIREAQLIRGNPMKKIADWVPITIPLLVSSLESAFILAESLTSRGFQHKASLKNKNVNLAVMLIGVFLIFAGWIFNLYDYPQPLIIAIYCVGIGLILLIFWLVGREVKISSFSKTVWQTGDILFVVVNLIIICFLIGLRFSGQLITFNYSPYPSLSFPEISLFGILFSLTPGLPMFFINHD
jgi:energy-coupling factor transport system permease protein